MPRRGVAVDRSAEVLSHVSKSFVIYVKSQGGVAELDKRDGWKDAVNVYDSLQLTPSAARRMYMELEGLADVSQSRATRRKASKDDGDGTGRRSTAAAKSTTTTLCDEIRAIVKEAADGAGCADGTNDDAEVGVAINRRRCKPRERPPVQQFDPSHHGIPQWKRDVRAIVRAAADSADCADDGTDDNFRIASK